jgi:TRAP transporter 4TM/12TM fusion protein
MNQSPGSPSPASPRDQGKPLAVPDVGGVLTDVPQVADAPDVLLDPEHGLPPGFGFGWTGQLLTWIAIAFSLFQIATAFNVPLDHRFVGLTIIDLLRITMAIWLVAIAFRAARRQSALPMLLAWIPLFVVVELLARFGGSIPNQILRALHVGFLCLVAGGLLAQHRSPTPVARYAAWALAGIGFAIGLYHWVLYEELVARAGEVTQGDLVVGIAAIAVLFVVCWRFMGPALPIVSGLFLAYCLFGQYLPAPLDHRGYSLDQVIEHMSFGTEGIYATPTGVSATFIFLFILFGSFLERAGMIQLFTDIAMGLFGGARGGPAKVAVFSSALMGTISGSGVANVVSTGQFTIPLMKRFGYSSAFAGGVEATASMGGQLMPPVMGAVAFIMAETIDVPYAAVVQAAIIPAILYYTAAFLAVHLEAGKRGLVGLPRNELPSASQALSSKWYLVLPLAALVYLLFAGYTPLFAGSVGLALTVVLILGGSLALGIGPIAIRLLFWVGLGLLCATFFWFGILVIVGIVIALILANLFTKGGAETVIACREALADGARQAVPVGIACAVVGIVIGTMTLTGVGTIFGNAVVAVGKESLFLALVLTMIVSLILGMGIPTIPNYIITSSLAAPILLKLGVPLVVSHMFVFYFGIMADLTPPVALAAFAAAPIAKESGFKIGFQAMKIAMAGFVIPLMAVYDPALMLQPVAGVTGTAYVIGAVYIVGKTLLAICLWGAATIGFLKGDMTFLERLIAAAGAGALVTALPITDEIGFALALLLGFLHFWRVRKLERAAA